MTKFILFLLCRCLGHGSSSVAALAQDHRNDVLSNIVAVICGYFGTASNKCLSINLKLSNIVLYDMAIALEMTNFHGFQI